MTTPRRITEHVRAPFRGARPNRDAGTIDGVLICGTASANGRDYPVAVLRRDCARYEGRPVNCDHGRESTVERRLGWFTNVRPGPDGRPRGTLNLLRSHPMYERVMEAAERNPALYGFSHVALCDTRPGPDGREVVEAIRAVESIDLVAQPATTKGLFEGAPVPFTRARLVEWLAAHPASTRRQLTAARRLAEIDGPDGTDGTDMPAADAPPPPDAGAAAPLDAAFLAAATDELKACMAAKGDPKALGKCLTKLKKMLRAHADITADDADTDADTDTDEPLDDDTDTDDGAPKPESARRRAGAVLEALDVCERLGYRPGREDLELIAAAPRDRRAALAARLQRAAAPAPERPTSAGRGRLGALTRASESKPPADPKAFAEWIE
ncbi:hypothetical protein R5W23_005509 [Gemmata sp. JC673]|uniref:Uncharacterized protein n=1 Tax=Gemmata algarum TaxID=2975278 RepID=A0ABU5EXJ0_9BACT|nr:hypothetical protein [Gemmata algarum]MDY3558416.1 hypothetical protein [Gemmata algarum]